MSNDGKYLEQIVHVLEISLNPNCRVEHDVQMPVIGSNEKLTRQCDVVIYGGSRARPTITIVEVQDRTRKPNINEFGGWVHKKRQVGAQHLICVSAMGFPSSIIEEAKRHGHGVKLIELQEIPKDEIPLEIQNSFHFSQRLFRNMKVSRFEVRGSQEDFDAANITPNEHTFKTLTLDDELFSTDKETKTSLLKIFENKLLSGDEKEGTMAGSFKIGEEELYFLVKNVWLYVEFEYQVEWYSEKTPGRQKVMTYKQNEDGILCWSLEAELDTLDGLVKVNLPLEKVSGGYRIPFMKLNAPPHLKINLEVTDREVNH